MPHIYVATDQDLQFFVNNEFLIDSVFYKFYADILCATLAPNFLVIMQDCTNLLWM